MTTSTTTPAPFTTGSSVTIHYTGYKAWVGRSYYGTKSGCKAYAESKTVTVGRITEKAIEFKTSAADGGTVICWVPKSCISDVEGKWTVSRGFCYRSGGLQWKRGFVQRRPWVHANNGRSFTMAG